MVYQPINHKKLVVYCLNLLLSIALNCVTICFRFWRSMYNRYDNDVHPRETVLDALSSIIDHNDSLQDHIKFLSSVSIVKIMLSL